MTGAHFVLVLITAVLLILAWFEWRVGGKK